MKTKRYSTEQIIGILKEAEAGMPVKELCRKYGVREASFLVESEEALQRLSLQGFTGAEEAGLEPAVA